MISRKVKQFRICAGRGGGARITCVKGWRRPPYKHRASVHLIDLIVVFHDHIPFPVKYGYCAVARVEEGPAEWLGRLVFALHPHQARFRLPLSALTPLPEGLPPARAALAANMETALNVTWDAGVGPGDLRETDPAEASPRSCSSDRRPTTQDAVLHRL